MYGVETQGQGCGKVTEEGSIQDLTPSRPSRRQLQHKGSGRTSVHFWVDPEEARRTVTWPPQSPAAGLPSSCGAAL